MVHEAFGRVIDMTNNTLHSLVCAENIYSTIYWTAYQWGWNGEKQKRNKKQTIHSDDAPRKHNSHSACYSCYRCLPIHYRRPVFCHTLGSVGRKTRYGDASRHQQQHTAYGSSFFIEQMMKIWTLALHQYIYTIIACIQYMRRCQMLCGWKIMHELLLLQWCVRIEP